LNEDEQPASYTLQCKVKLKKQERKTMKEIINESLRYWESRRVAFTAALALVVVASFYIHGSSVAGLTWQSVAGLLLAAVIANVLYCTAYVADIFVQLSEYQQMWKRHRRALLVTGTALAAALFVLHE
jgi:preprotein translocase subunit SecF